MTVLSIIAALALAQTEVAVDAGAMTPELVALLRFERPDLAFTSSTATSAMRVSLKRDRELLSLEVLENGAPRIERTITIERERVKPALRVAALLVVEALAPRPIAPIAPESPPSWALSAALGGDYWIAPGAARIGPTIAAHYSIDAQLAIGARVISNGLIAGQTLNSNALAGNVLEVTPLLDVAYALTELGPNRLKAIGAIGFTVASFNGTASFPAINPSTGAPVMSTEQTKTAFEGAARIGVAFETPPVVSGARLWIAAGVRFRLARMIVQLPAELRNNESGLDPGIASPFLELGTTFDAF